MQRSPTLQSLTPPIQRDSRCSENPPLFEMIGYTGVSDCKTCSSGSTRATSNGIEDRAEATLKRCIVGLATSFFLPRITRLFKHTTCKFFAAFLTECAL